MVKKDSRYDIHSPWSWAIEPVRGCNLRCGHCATRLFEVGKLDFASEKTWVDLFSLINKITPYCRVEMANAGEPTLHPRILPFLSIARRLAPNAQLQITTNGTKLADGTLTHKQLFNAGINIIYVDMYAPREKHIALAEASGYEWYEYLDPPKGAPNAWTYHGSHVKFITLMQPPVRWPAKRLALGRLGTWFNNLDWKAAEKYNLFPVTEPIERGCSQPFKYVSVMVDGSFELCCQDLFGETAGKLGNVSDGVEGFDKFWFGEFMQLHRKHLRVKDRAWSPYCSRCNITFSMSDWRMWKDDALTHYWDGESWKELIEEEGESND